MIATIQYNSRKLKIDLLQPLDISMPIKGDASNVNAWYIGPPKIEPEVIDGEIVSVANGAVVNFNTISFIHIRMVHTRKLLAILQKKSIL